MYKSVTILFIVCFGIYILFTRTPDYFEADTFHGVIKKEAGNYENWDSITFLKYVAERDTISVPITDWYGGQVHDGEKVKVIYNPANPKEAAIYTFFGYWIKINELVTSALIFVMLFLAAIFITGENSNIPYTEEELSKKRKYKG